MAPLTQKRIQQRKLAKFLLQSNNLKGHVAEEKLQLEEGQLLPQWTAADIIPNNRLGRSR